MTKTVTTTVPEFNQDELLILLIALANQNSGDPGVQDRINALIDKVHKFIYDVMHEAG